MKEFEKKEKILENEIEQTKKKDELLLLRSYFSQSTLQFLNEDPTQKNDNLFLTKDQLAQKLADAECYSQCFLFNCVP